MLDPSDTLIGFGGAAKALDAPGRKVGGYLVLFGDPESADLQGEYFTKATDFGLAERGRIRFHHTRDPELGLCPVGEARVELRDEGVWCEGEIAIKAADADRWAKGICDRREQYERKVLDMVKAGKLGWSSSAAAHLVRTMGRGKATEITSWPLADDFTLSPTPVDPRNAVVPLKALDLPGTKAGGIYPGVGHSAALAAVERLHSGAMGAMGGHMGGDRKGASRDERLAGCKAALDEYHRGSMAMLKAGMDHEEPDGDEGEAALKSLLNHALTRLHDGLRLGDHSEMARATVAGFLARSKAVAAMRRADGRSLPAERLAALKALGEDLIETARLLTPKADPTEVLRLRAEFHRLTAGL